MAESIAFIFERANSALITRDFEYAEHLLTTVLNKQSSVTPEQKVQAEELLARIYVNAGDFKRALEAYLRLYVCRPKDTKIMNSLGRIYRHLGRFHDSLAILEKAKEIDSSTDMTLYNLAKTYKQMRDYKRAAEYFSLALQLKPDQAHIYDRLGNLYVLTGEKDKAIKTYKSGLHIDPNHPYLNFHLAGLLRKAKRYEEALNYYNAALRTNPSWAEALHDLADTYVQLGKSDEALHIYRSLISVSGKTAPICTELGRLFEKKRLETEAERYYYDALALENGYAPAVLALSGLLEKRKAYDENLAVLLSAEAAPINKDNHELRLKAIQSSMYAKDYAKTHELMRKLNAQYANDITALKLKGQLAALTGDSEEAERTFKTILDISPAAIEFRRELAEQYLAANRYQDAKKQLELFLKQKPIDMTALMLFGQTLEALNNPQQAYQTYQKVLENNPDAIEARTALSHLYQKHGNTLEALKTANDILNLQSTSTNATMIQGLAETLELYEQAAEHYMTDPMSTKNLHYLETEESDLYIPPTELKQDSLPLQAIPLFEEIPEQDREMPFDLLLEKADEDEKLENEDAETFEDIQLNMCVEDGYSALSHVTPPQTQMQSVSSPGRSTPPESAGFIPSYTESPEAYPAERPSSTAGSTASSTPAFSVHGEELRSHSPQSETISPFDLKELSEILSNASKPAGKVVASNLAEKRLESLNTYDTGVEFLQDVAADLVQEFDAKRYKQVIETLAAKIAENLADKGYKPQAPEQPQPRTAQEQKNGTANEPAVIKSTDMQETETAESPLQMLAEKETTGDDICNVIEPAVSEPANLSALEEILKEEQYEPVIVFDTENDKKTDDVPPQERLHNSEPFVLDEIQQNLLWCHAKRKLKDSPDFEEYLSTADTEQLACLFLYLRDLLAFLPDDKHELFLSSLERIQVHYIISRLSGNFGLKERADLINQSLGWNTSSDKTLFELFEYLQNLTAALPDRPLAERCKQELGQVIVHLSSVATEEV